MGGGWGFRGLQGRRLRRRVLVGSVGGFWWLGVAARGNG